MNIHPQFYSLSFCQATQERAGLIRINMLLGKKKGKKVDRNWMLKTKMVERQTKKKQGTDTSTGTWQQLYLEETKSVTLATPGKYY